MTGITTRRARHPAGLALVLCLLAAEALGAAPRITNYISPRNAERCRRKSTQYIILHTTEGARKGSLEKLRANGEAHYLVDESGHVYRIVDRDRIAFHAGRSMWSGRTNLDECSIGIEMVGYHNRALSDAQMAALRDLLGQLKGIYKIPDERVLTHCMVAYGAPNRWHAKSHRGRKRCGLLLARRDVRARLGLLSQPAFDPDVRAGRLVVGDPYLAQALYGSARQQTVAVAHYTAPDASVISPTRSAWDIAGDTYNSARTLYLFPDGERRRGDEIRDWKRMPAGTRVVVGLGERENPPERIMAIGADGATASAIAGGEAGAVTTIYFLPDGRVRRGDELSADELAALPSGTRMLVGYTAGGSITARRSAFDICGVRWDKTSTFYRLPDGSLVSGDRLRENAIPKNAMVFFQN